MEWSTDVIMEFLDLYEGEPSIWNPQDADNRDRNKIYEAWKRIQGSMSVEYSLTELKKKKETLMATYRKIALKIKNSTKSGAGTKEAYKPQWFAYDKMTSFLHNIYTPRETKKFDQGPAIKWDDNEDDLPTNEYAIPDPLEYSFIQTDFHNEESYETEAAEAAVTDQDGPSTSKKRKTENTGNVAKRIDEAYTSLKQVGNPETAKDEISLYCDLLRLKLRALDDDTREIAMHEINNLMFNFKKPKIRQLYWSHSHNYQQPGHFANVAPQQPGRSVNPVESLNDGSNANSVSSYSSFGDNNPPATSTSQDGSNDNQIEMPFQNAA